MKIEISVKKTVALLSASIALLMVLGLAAHYVLRVSGTARCHSCFDVWDLDMEESIPTWFESVMLLVTAVLVAAVARQKSATKDPWRIHWWMLSAGFLAMSIDEQAAIHERFIRPLRDLWHTGGFFYFAWVIPGLFLAAAALIIYARFLAALPVRTRWLFFFAGFLFTTGAVGIEMLEGHHAASHGYMGIQFGLLADLEEFLEMTGILLFDYAVLKYILDTGTARNITLEIKP